MPSLGRWVVIVAVWLNLCVYDSKAHELTLCGIDGSVNHAEARTILEKAYARIGVSIISKSYPAKRSLALSNSGKCDGEMQRIEGITDFYPDLVKVPEPLFYLEGSAFVKNKSLSIEAWEDLDDHLIGVPRGVVYLEKRTEGLNRIIVNELERLFELLDLERVDVVIISKNYGEDYLRKHPELQIHLLTPPLLHIPLFHYLHKKHAPLVNKISDELKNMRRRGELQPIITQ